MQIPTPRNRPAPPAVLYEHISNILSSFFSAPLLLLIAFARTAWGVAERQKGWLIVSGKVIKIMFLGLPEAVKTKRNDKFLWPLLKGACDESSPRLRPAHSCMQMGGT